MQNIAQYVIDIRYFRKYGPRKNYGKIMYVLIIGRVEKCLQIHLKYTIMSLKVTFIFIIVIFQL